MLTPHRRVPAALAALALVGTLAFAAPAQADDLDPATAEVVEAAPSDVAVVAPEEEAAGEDAAEEDAPEEETPGEETPGEEAPGEEAAEAESEPAVEEPGAEPEGETTEAPAFAALAAPQGPAVAAAVAPVACVAIPGWAEEDLPPIVTAAGLVFKGPKAQSVNYYQRVSAGNAQGITGMSYTIAPGTTGYKAELKVEVDPNADLGSGVIHYATLSTINTASEGVIDAQNAQWYTSKIAYASPGGMGNPLSWDDLIALMPNNTLLSAPSLHLQTNSTADSHSTVTKVTSSCGTTNFVTPVTPPATSGGTGGSPSTPTTGTDGTTALAATPTSTPTPTPTPTSEAGGTGSGSGDADNGATDELPTEAFDGSASSDGAPWWPWAVGVAILLLLALLWFLIFRKRFGIQP